MHSLGPSKLHRLHTKRAHRACCITTNWVPGQSCEHALKTSPRHGVDSWKDQVGSSQGMLLEVAMCVCVCVCACVSGGWGGWKHGFYLPADSIVERIVEGWQAKHVQRTTIHPALGFGVSEDLLLLHGTFMDLAIFCGCSEPGAIATS